MQRTDSNKKIIFIILIAAVIGLALRIPFFANETKDFDQYLSAWMNSMDSFGKFQRFGAYLGDYTCPYTYVLAAITLFPVNRLYAVKAVSVLFDFFLAYFVFDIVYNLTQNKTKAAFSYLVVFLCPTVIMDSAAWAQCDAIYTTFLIGTIAFILKDKPIKASIMYGLAFALKLQSIFIAPLFICLWLKKRIKIKHMLLIPLMYCLSVVPALLAGRNFFSVFSVYFQQGTEYTDLSMNAPSLWGFAQDFKVEETPILSLAGIGAAGLSVLILLITVYRTKFTISESQWLDLACIFALIIPFLLPRMHERYFYPADMLTITYAFNHKKRWYVPVLSISASIFTYLIYLLPSVFSDCRLWILSIAILASLIILITGYYKDYYKSYDKKVKIN